MIPLVTPTVWTSRRKWMGNLIPAFVWLPLSIAAIAWMVLKGEIVGPGLWLLAAATVLGWLAVNLWGLFENRKMRLQLARILEAKGTPSKDAPFVGIATPRYSSMVDPHEEVGFLTFHQDRIEFLSETKTIELFRSQVQRIRFRANVHTLLGLGRWISVEGTADGKPIRLMIEPRERQTLIGNLFYSKSLLYRLRRWLNEKP